MHCDYRPPYVHKLSGQVEAAAAQHKSEDGISWRAISYCCCCMLFSTTAACYVLLLLHVIFFCYCLISGIGTWHKQEGPAPPVGEIYSSHERIASASHVQ